MALHVRNLTAGYGGAPVLKQCSFSISDGETLVLMGPSGCGKTTLLHCLSGVLTPYSGIMSLDGRELSKLPMEARRIGLLPQDYGLFPHMSVSENVEYGLMVHGLPPSERSKVSAQMLKLVNLPGLGPRSITELSGGQRQRVGLARALAVRPGLLLLDEPLSNIDQITKDEVAHNLRRVFEKISVPKIVVTHGLFDALVLADRLAVMLDGRIVQLDTPQRVLAKPANELVRKLVRRPNAQEILRSR